jgi:cysteine synthase
MPRKPPDWTRTGTVAGFAEGLRRNSGAICVLVIRPHDSVLAIDPLCAPCDAEQLVKDYLPRLVERVDLARREKKQAARLELGPCPE